MKTPGICFFLSLFFVQSVVAQQQPSWEWQNPLPNGYDYSKIIALSESNYFLFGKGGVISKTTDGGLSWQTDKVDIQQRDFLAATFVTPLIGHAVGGRGLFCSTSDGGNSWQMHPNFSLYTHTGIHFINPDTGIISTSSGGVYRTSDGGTTWTGRTIGLQVISQYSPSNANDSVVFLGSGHATQGILRISSDAGINWGNATSRLDYNNGAVLRIIFKENFGFITTTIGRIVKTTDYGETWSTVFNLAENFKIYDITYTANNNLYAVGDLGKIFRSTDNGTSWSIDSLPHWQSLNSVAAIGNEVVIAGAGGIVAKSNNNGTSFDIITTAATREHIYKASFVNKSVGFAVGGSNVSWNSFGDILKTTNGGLNWQKLPFSPDAFVSSVCFLSESTGYIGVKGPSGIYKTTDGGLNWLQLTTGFAGQNATINDIVFLNENKGLACFSDGTLARTTDAGANWTLVNIGFGYYPVYDICVADSQTIYVAGFSIPFYGGCVSKSTNGGETFSLTSPVVSTEHIFSMHFFNAQEGVFVTSYGKIWNTSNGGVSFTQVNHPYNGQLSTVKFINRNKGWIGGVAGKFYYTIDGGLTWVLAPVYLGTKQGIHDIQIVEDEMWILGTNGMIMHAPADPVLTSADEFSISNSLSFSLGQNYPNPFNPTTTIEYTVNTTSELSLIVYDALGKEVTRIASGLHAPGRYEAVFNGIGLSSGIYYYALRAGAKSAYGKMILMK